MEYAFLLFAVIICSALRSICLKISTDGKSFYDKTKINAIVFLIVGISALLMGLHSLSTIFKVPWILAIIYALSTVLAHFFLMIAFEVGSVSFSSLIYNCSFIVPTIFGIVFYSEESSIVHITGIALIIVSFCLSVKSDGGKGGISWFIVSLLAVLFGGVLGCVQKILGNEYPDVLLDNFVQLSFIFAFLIGALIAFFTYLFFKRFSHKIVGHVEKIVKKNQIKRSCLYFNCGRCAWCCK